MRKSSKSKIYFRAYFTFQCTTKSSCQYLLDRWENQFNADRAAGPQMQCTLDL